MRVKVARKRPLAWVLALAVVNAAVAVIPSSAHGAGDGEFLNPYTRHADVDCTAENFPAKRPLEAAQHPVENLQRPVYSRVTAIDLCLEVMTPGVKARVSIVSRNLDGEVYEEYASAEFTPDGGGPFGTGVAWNHIELVEPIDPPPFSGAEIMVQGSSIATFSWLAECDDVVIDCDDHTDEPIWPPTGEAYGSRTWTDSSSNQTISIDGPPTLCHDLNNFETSNIGDFSVTVTNNGEQRNRPRPSHLHARNVLIGDVNHPLFSLPLDPGQSDTVSANQYLNFGGDNAVLELGPNQLRVVLDPENTFVESNEDDNEAVMDVTVVDCG